MKGDAFNATVTFEDILDAAQVKMDPRGLYFAKPYRKCEYLAAFNSCVRMALSAKDKEITRLHRENAQLADRCSKESAQRATLAEENARVTKLAIARGLETLDIPVTTRERLLTMNGS